MIELAAGEWRTSLRPEIGGCLASLDLVGRPVLRTMPSAADHPLQSACFPLVPYCNRIADGKFAFRDRQVSLAPNLPPQRHPLHGTGWLRAWRTVRRDETSALLEDDYAGDGDWPWAYRAHQHIALDASGLTIRLIVENRGDGPAPLGLGLHPYFRRRAESVVTFAAERMLGIDDEYLPSGRSFAANFLAPWEAGSHLPDTLVDHCFAGWSGRTTVADAHGTIELRGFGAPHCHVYAPPGGEELCIEPVSHTPDALNRDPQSVPVMAPRTAAALAMRIEATSA